MIIKKKILGLFYLLTLMIIFFLIINYDIYNKLSYDSLFFYKEKIILFKESHLMLSILIFSISSMIWVFLMGFIFPFIVISGLLFGQYYGTIICVISFTFGATANFAFAKYFFKKKVNEFFRNKYPTIKKTISKNNFRYFLLLRILPGIPFPVKNLSGVLFDLSRRKFFFATFLGEIPQIYLFVTFFQNFFYSLNNSGKINLKFIYSFEIIFTVVTYFLIILTADFLRKKFLN